jgi:hypothetical protein
MGYEWPIVSESYDAPAGPRDAMMHPAAEQK